MSVDGVAAAQPALQRAGGGATQSPAPRAKDLEVRPIPWQVAKALFVRHHYLHAMPGGSLFNLGAFFGQRLMGAICFTRGPKEAHKLVDGAKMRDCACLARLWLDDALPHNSESRVIGQALNAIRRHTSLRFIISYSDPSQNHLGIVYQATNWTYTGLSAGTPRYDLGDGVGRHSRSVSNKFGSHSVAHFQANGIVVRLVSQVPKHRYLYVLDPAWRQRLNVPSLPYPKKGGNSSGDC